jgi:hypothetical protein
MKLFIATVLSACLIGPASAFAVPADVHQPPTVNTAVYSSSLGAGPQAGSQPVDLRSPDAVAASQPTPVSSQPATVDSSSSDFDWGDAAIGAGTMLAIALVTLGVFLITQNTRRQHRSAV